MSSTPEIPKDTTTRCKAEALDAKANNPPSAHDQTGATDTALQPLSPGSQNDADHAGGMATTSSISDQTEMRQRADREVRDMLHDAGHYSAPEKGHSSRGGRRSARLLSPLARVQAIRQTLESFEKRIISLQAQQASMEQHLQNRTFCHNYYKPLRNRFISTFKRDILGNATSEDLQIIAEGNECADCGDAIADATLYDVDGERSDITTYIQLYGFHPAVVQMIRPGEAIDIMNAHATTIASKQKTVSNMFHRRFAHFLKVFAEYGRGYEPDIFSGDPTEVTRAYWEFADCLKTEVRMAGDSD